MGLFFRKKKEESMDMPPPPPDMKKIGSGSEMPKFPEMPPLESKDSGSEQMPDYESDNTDNNMDDIIPELPPLDINEDIEFEGDFPKIKPKEDSMEEDKLQNPKEDNKKPEHQKMPEKHEREMPEVGPKFLKVSSFQQIIDEVEAIRSGIKHGEQCVNDVHSINSAGEKELEKWRQSLEDAQRKIGYVDSIIFKGE